MEHIVSLVSQVVYHSVYSNLVWKLHT